MSVERKSLAMMGNAIISVTAAMQKTDILTLQVTAELSLLSEFDQEERIERKRKLLERLREEERKIEIEGRKLEEALNQHTENLLDSLEAAREIKKKRSEKARERESSGLVIGPNGVLEREDEGEGDRLVDEDDEAPVSSIPEADEE